MAAFTCSLDGCPNETATCARCERERQNGKAGLVCTHRFYCAEHTATCPSCGHETIPSEMIGSPAQCLECARAECNDWRSEYGAFAGCSCGRHDGPRLSPSVARILHAEDAPALCECARMPSACECARLFGEVTL